MSDLRVAVVGTGLMGKDHVRRLGSCISGARVSAIVEPAVERAQAALELAPGAQAFARVEDALAAGVVDAVVVAVPGHLHLPVLRPVLEAGLPVLCEKPLTQDSASSWEVLQLEQRLSRPHIQLGFMRRFDAEYQQLRDFVAAGELGELLLMHCVHRNPFVPEGYTNDMLITDSVVHEFDVVPYLAGSPLRRVEVKFPRRSRRSPEQLREPILVLLELENGVLVDVEMNVSVEFGYQVATELVFERGVARGGQPAGVQLWEQGRFSVREHGWYTSRFAAAYDAQMQRWVDAVRSGVLVDGPNAWDGYLVAVACEAGLRAMHEGGVVDVVTPERPAFYVSR